MWCTAGDQAGTFKVPKITKRGELKEDETEEASVTTLKPLIELMGEAGLHAVSWPRRNMHISPCMTFECIFFPLLLFRPAVFLFRFLA